ncbi:MAG: PIG-L family deacetylase [Candidatus Hydrogenedentes bacterium]|nr:PIG-L family deacetylase [Candidatus Hydrogenedentota bacterium]
MSGGSLRGILGGMKLQPVAVCILCFALLIPAARAGQTELGEAAQHQALLDQGTGLRLMCVAAHPDDEDGATLAMYRKRHGYKTIAVIATRGEGGQNEIGPELYNELGVIRTHEMMRAAQITGAELHFLNLPEFGFSKSPEETFEVWGREETVRRLVRVIRLTRPDVIITNHGISKDHGHHQAIGLALQEAFDAAGDPARFPELAAEGLEPWQPQRLYLRSWEPVSGAVTVDPNMLDPVLGKTYAEIAAQALNEHFSQGMGFFIDRYLSGSIRAHYVRVKEYLQSDASGEVLDASRGVLFEGMRNRPFEPATAQGQTPCFAPQSLRERRGQSHLRAELRLSALADDQSAIPGQSIAITATVTDFGVREAHEAVLRIEPRPWFGAGVPEPQMVTFDAQGRATAAFALAVPATAPLTVPGAAHLFDAHFLEPQFDVVAAVTASTGDIALRLPMTIDVAPPVEVTFADAPYLVRKGADVNCTFNAVLTNHSPGPCTGAVVFSMAPGFLPDTQRAEYAFAAEGEQRVIPVTSVVGENLEPRDYLLNAMIEGETEPHFATARLVDLKVPEGITVGVIQSYDDTFMNTLEKMHVAHQALTLEDFTPARLDAFSTIIVDIRAYLVRPDLVANNQALLEFAKRGGCLLVMYQKTGEWKPEFAPYPIQLSRNRVTREDAAVTVLAPEHPVFTQPNLIGEADWGGWIQERGLYFPGEWDAQYTPLIACADPGEDIPPGSLLHAKTGEGDYVYLALGLYRQLRELHPGALRLFANLLALGEPRTP